MKKDSSMDISLYLDDVCETSMVMEQKLNGKTNAELYDMSSKKDKIQK